MSRVLFMSGLLYLSILKRVIRIKVVPLPSVEPTTKSFVASSPPRKGGQFWGAPALAIQINDRLNVAQHGSFHATGLAHFNLGAFYYLVIFPQRIPVPNLYKAQPRVVLGDADRRLASLRSPVPYHVTFQVAHVPVGESPLACWDQSRRQTRTGGLPGARCSNSQSSLQAEPFHVISVPHVGNCKHIQGASESMNGAISFLANAFVVLVFYHCSPIIKIDQPASMKKKTPISTADPLGFIPIRTICFLHLPSAIRSDRYALWVIPKISALFHHGFHQIEQRLARKDVHPAGPIGAPDS